MEQRPLGQTDLTIGAISLGCATLGREIDEDTSRQLLDHALERGITFLDSAEAYGGGNARLSRIQNHGIDDTEWAESSASLGAGFVRTEGRARGPAPTLARRRTEMKPAPNDSNDATYNKVFPYAGTPLNGRNHPHH